MKTQTNHSTRQLIHSHELARARIKRAHCKMIRRYKVIGWSLCATWLLWVGVAVACGGV